MGNPFEVLGLPMRFDLTREQIETRWKELSMALHPDRHARGSAAERREALSRAVAVNEAHRALRDELTRAEAILKARDVPAEAPADPALLMEVMEAREQLAEHRASADRAALDRLAHDAQRRIAADRESLRAAIDGEPMDPLAARRALSRMRYARRYLDEIELVRETITPS